MGRHKKDEFFQDIKKQDTTQSSLFNPNGINLYQTIIAKRFIAGIDSGTNTFNVLIGTPYDMIMKIAEEKFNSKPIEKVVVEEPKKEVKKEVIVPEILEFKKVEEVNSLAPSVVKEIAKTPEEILKELARTGKDSDSINDDSLVDEMPSGNDEGDWNN